MSDEALQQTIREILSSYSESAGNGTHTFAGNEPDEVIVQIKGNKLAISVFSRRWDGPSSLVVHSIPIATMNWRRMAMPSCLTMDSKTNTSSLIPPALKSEMSFPRAGNDSRSNTNMILEMVGCMRFFLKDVWRQPRGKNTLSVLRANEPVHLKMSVGYLATMSTWKSSAIPTMTNTRKCWSGGASSIQKSSIPKRYPERCNVEWLKAKMRISYQQSYNSFL